VNRRLIKGPTFTYSRSDAVDHVDAIGESRRRLQSDGVEPAMLVAHESVGVGRSGGEVPVRESSEALRKFGAREPAYGCERRAFEFVARDGIRR